jgi:hypothetical protein
MMPIELQIYFKAPLVIQTEADPATAKLLAELLANQTKIMSAISDFATAQNAFQDKVDAAITDIATELKTANDQIAALQASQGGITPSDQALLDGIQARTSAAATKLAALDTLTPPTPPAA